MYNWCKPSELIFARKQDYLCELNIVWASKVNKNYVKDKKSSQCLTVENIFSLLLLQAFHFPFSRLCSAYFRCCLGVQLTWRYVAGLNEIKEFFNMQCSLPYDWEKWHLLLIYERVFWLVLIRKAQENDKKISCVVENLFYILGGFATISKWFQVTFYVYMVFD